MKFKLYTLVDITETNARFNKFDRFWKQQQNFLTVLQTIGLRSNPTEIKVLNKILDIKDLDFGSAYKGKHNVWTLVFSIENVDGTSIEMLNHDFNNIPVIDNLDETAKFKNAHFSTKNNTIRNVYFELDDK